MENKVHLIGKKVALIEIKVYLIEIKDFFLHGPIMLPYITDVIFSTFESSACSRYSYGTRHMEWTWTAKYENNFSGDEGLKMIHR